MNEYSCIQIKFYLQKEVVKRIRRQDTDWKKIFAKDISDKGLLSELLKLNNKERKNLI